MNTKKLLKLVNRGLYFGSAALLVTALFLSVAVQPAQAVANPGAIWTTTGSCGSPQDSNHYAVFDTVYINYSGFSAGSYAWKIQQADGTPPKPIVASGTRLVDASGAGCFAAHVIQPPEANHEYQTTFGNKGDNYQVDPYNTPTPTKTSTKAPTATFTPTNVPPTATFTATFTPTNVPPTATFTATFTPTDTSEPTATFTPTNTEVPPTETEVPPTETQVPPTDTQVPPTETQVPPTQGTPLPTATSVPPTPTPEQPTVTPENPSPTPTTPAPTATKLPPPGNVLEPPTITVDPVCTVDGQMQWYVLNPNSKDFPVEYYTVDGVSKGGLNIPPGKHKLTTTPAGTHSVVLYYGESQSVSLSFTIDVCPLPVPVTGGTTLIPVTGADDTGNLVKWMLFGSSSLAGLGLVLSALRKLLQL